MELRQLEHFVAVAEEASFTSAARRLHLVPSGLSTSIHTLERDLGVPLFDRNTRHVALTQAGQAFLAEARRTLTAARAAHDAVAGLRGAASGRLSIGANQVIQGTLDLPALIASFHAIHPEVALQSAMGMADDLFERVRRRELDLALAMVASGGPQGLATTLLGHDSLELACPPLHPMSGEEQASLADLAGESFVALAPNSHLRQYLDRILHAERITPRLVAEVESIPMLLSLVAAGLGVAIVPQTASAYPANLVFIPLSPPLTIEHVVAAASEPPPNPAARLFLAQIQVTLAPLASPT